MDKDYENYRSKVMEYFNVEYTDTLDNYLCMGSSDNIESFGVGNYQDLQNNIEETIMQCYAIPGCTIPNTCGEIANILEKNLGRAVYETRDGEIEDYNDYT